MGIGVLGYKRKVVASGESRAHALRGLVLLAGTVRPGHMGSLIGRPIFDLPLEQGGSILESWRRQAARLADLTAAGTLPIRIMLDRAAPDPQASVAEDPAAPVSVERDPFEYRGTGGVLRDLAVGYADDDLLLVANASQVLTEPFAELALELMSIGGDVGIVSHADGSPSGILLVRCGAVRELPAAGFVDMKEQALPMIARHHSVRVLERQRPTALPTRSLSEYVAALRAHHGRLAGVAEESDPFAEDWETRFAIVEEGGWKHPNARMHDSVVLRGGRVETNAVVVQSLVCGGGEVRRGLMAVDAVVAPPAQKGRRR
jgi:mannose-1-phosphate guanylyltransferase